MGRKKLDPALSPKHNCMLVAASRMFIDKGYDAVSMDAVADAAPVSKRTLYNHFKDKKSLFSAVMQSRCSQFSATMAQSLQDCRNAEQALTRIGQQFLGAVLEPDSLNMYRVIINQSQQFPELGKLFYESGPARTRQLLADYLKGVHKKGELNVPNPELAGNMFIGMLINRVHMQCLLGQKKNVSKREKDEIVRYAVQLFVRGHKS
jgi:TetR/AcrR family transcriptional repressor of mexJK operon